jgi:hypothetical protein
MTMGKWVADEVLNGALAIVAGADRAVALGAQPATYASAWSGRLAETPLSAGDFSIEPGDGSGRKVTIAAKPGANVLAPGSATHVALLDTVGERLLYVTTCPDQPLAMGGTVNFESWSVEIGAPV